MEEGFAEASFAVSKALERAETAASEASAAAARADKAAAGEEAARQDVAMARQESSRLREDLAQAAARLQAAQVAAAEQQQAAQRALQQQLDAAEAQLAAAQVRSSGRSGRASPRGLFLCAALALAQPLGALWADPVLRLAPQQAAARGSEQKVASLEAALERSSAAAVSMTEKMAQAVGDAGAQAEALKVGWAGGELEVERCLPRIA